MSSRALVVLAAAAALLGCGKSAEEERMENVRRVCEGLVPGTSTLREAEVALSGSQLPLAWACDSSSSTTGSSDVCDYGASVCQFDFAFYQGDPGACENTLQGLACWYGCGLRTSEADWTTNGGDDATVCARFFYGPQLTPLIPRN